MINDDLDWLMMVDTTGELPTKAANGSQGNGVGYIYVPYKKGEQSSPSMMANILSSRWDIPVPSVRRKKPNRGQFLDDKLCRIYAIQRKQFHCARPCGCLEFSGGLTHNGTTSQVNDLPVNWCSSSLLEKPSSIWRLTTTWAVSSCNDWQTAGVPFIVHNPWWPTQKKVVKADYTEFSLKS